MDMVDSALERPDVALSKRGTRRLMRVPLRALRSFFLTHFRIFFEIFEKKKKSKKCVVNYISEIKIGFGCKSN